MITVISNCGRYRYRLGRRWEIPKGATGGSIGFVMLNPSTADETLDDPTIRRLRGFSTAWGYNAFTVCNVYALRATDPKVLRSHPDPVGFENHLYLRQLAHSKATIVVAWGAHAAADDVARTYQILTEGPAQIMCLGTNMDGSPKHPLYLAANTQLQPWSP